MRSILCHIPYKKNLFSTLKQFQTAQQKNLENFFMFSGTTAKFGRPEPFSIIGVYTCAFNPFSTIFLGEVESERALVKPLHCLNCIFSH